jgi:hypothetical protein
MDPNQPAPVQPAASVTAPPSFSLSQASLDSLLAQLNTEVERAAARAGWAHAAAHAAGYAAAVKKDKFDWEHRALTDLYAGRKPEQIAADKGWKYWRMNLAEAEGKETFWCEKAPECILDQVEKKDSRPCVSNYFGRNKRQTTRIPSMVTWCRKHYQRSGYHGAKNPNNNLEWPREKAGLIREQLRRNEESYFHDTQQHLEYTVTLKKSEQDRLNYHNNHQGQSPARNNNAKSYEAPMSVLLHIFNTWTGQHRTYNDCLALTTWAEGQLDRDTCPDLPLWEMIPEYPNPVVDQEDEDDQGDDDDEVDEDDAGPVTPKKQTPKKTTPKSSGKKSSAKKGRISDHGSIQKP